MTDSTGRPGPGLEADLADELWTLSHLRRFTHLSRGAVYVLVRRPGFPAPLRLGAAARRPRWCAAEVRRWAAERSAGDGEAPR